MAKIRIGYGTDLVVENEIVGIKTDAPVSGVDIKGSVRATNMSSSGISTLTTYSGFLDNRLVLTSDIDINSIMGSSTADIIVDGDVTVAAGTTFTNSIDNISVTDTFTVPVGNIENRAAVGTTRFNEDLASLEFYTGVELSLIHI